MTDLKEITTLSKLLAGSSTDCFTSRRKLIGMLGMAGTALCASSIPARAGLFGNNDDIPVVKVKAIASDSQVGRSPSQVGRTSSQVVRTSSPSKNVGGFPEDWVLIQGRNLSDYALYLNTLKMRNISAQDVISAHAKQRGTVWNTLPPRQWWTRMGYTLRVIDRISSEMNEPVKEIVSAYRRPEYNSQCEGAKAHSWHQANVAVDVQFQTSPSNVTAASRSLRDRGLFKGGVGDYPTFTHIDTRGENVNW